MMSNKPPIGVIVGPTAVGKTDMAITVADRMENAEIISADSIQVYRSMDIGSAKPTAKEQRGIIHHMLDVAAPREGGFSVAVYQTEANKCIAEIISRDGFPIICGGTGLYVSSLTFPLDFTRVDGDPRLREELNSAEDASPGCLHEMLLKLDPAAAVRLHKNDRKRIVRAIELNRVTGKTLDELGGDFQNSAGREIAYAPQIYGLTMPRDVLYTRINARVDAMMESGLLDEVRMLLDSGCDRGLPAMQGLGYKQLAAHLAGEYDLATAVDTIKRETRRFAKRQLTWFRRDKRIIWLDTCEHSHDELAAIIYAGFIDARGG